MAAMTPERWARVQAIFEGAVALPPGGRDAYVAAECGADADLRHRVDRLLAADAAEQAAPADPAIHDAVRLAVDDLARAQEAVATLSRVGPYRIVREIGQGGMGAVYLAERDDDEFRQQVAIKIIRGLLDPERVRRFRAERQILAVLDHPNIARLLDGGTTAEGLPYLVMEYVEGVPIDQYADAAALSISDRLRLVGAVCDGVSHAHRALVVHRDLKPGNILVTADGVPKLLDFGIAKLLDEASPDAGLVTGPAMRLLTPDYASPEQVRSGRVTTATDVYAIGILLYELLTGRRLYRFRSMTSTEIERVVCDVEPVRPSLAVEEAAEGEDGVLEARAARRQTRPRRWAAQLAGDLDTIVAMALEKDPARRYSSVEALAEDLRRHRDGRPVNARPATIRYRTRRFVSRHRWGVATAALFLLLIAGASAGLVVQAARIAEERDAAALERDTAEQVSGFLIELFQVSDPSQARGNEVTARELLERGAERVDRELAAQPAVQGRIMHTIGEVYRSLGLFDESQAMLTRALEVRRTAAGGPSLEVAQSLNAAGEILRDRGRYDEAEALLDEALVMRRALVAPPHADIADSLNDLGLLYSQQGKYDAAEPLLVDAVTMWRATLGEDHPQVAIALSNLALLERHRSRYDEAERRFREVLEIRRRRLVTPHPQLANTLMALGQVLNLKGDFAEAEGPMREALAMRIALLGEDHHLVGSSQNNLAFLLHDLGRLDEAEPMYRAALAISVTRLGPDHPEVGVTTNNLGALMEARGDHVEAERLFREALRIRRAALGARHPAVARGLHNLGRALHALGRTAEARPLVQEALDMRRDLLGERNAETAISIALMAGLDAAQGRMAEADAGYRHALALQRELLGEDHLTVAITLVSYGAMLQRTGRAAEAEPLARDAVAIRTARLPDGHRLRREAEALLGEVQAAR
ncbi:MAG: serine/threonine-protein kinase [Vicinamibacterales bacterium]|nr:serine/threonine-protein kinase [Vicinamibacterales bacterium]